MKEEGKEEGEKKIKDEGKEEGMNEVKADEGYLSSLPEHLLL